ncbi:MAG: thiamine ABC transporter substrate-binding protein [Rectinemataceae bacterium]
MTVFRKIFSYALCAALVAALLASCAPSQPKTLTVWTYDSFVAEWGPGPAIAKLYKEKTGTELRFVAKGDGGALLASLLAEGTKADADLVVGLDDRLAGRALESGLFKAFRTKATERMPAEILVDPSERLLPYDYGHFAIMWDSESGVPAPASLEDLTKPEYAKKLIIMDPRTSSVGLGFLGWVQAVYGPGWKDYLARLAPSLLAMTPGWDVGYGLFTSGEAPMVLSYATSPAYHKAYDKTDRYKALLFEQGHAVQVELAGILAASKNGKKTARFMEFFLSPECQSLLPETQWMYPANPAAALPESFLAAPKPAITLPSPILDPETDPAAAAGILAAGARAGARAGAQAGNRADALASTQAGAK